MVNVILTITVVTCVLSAIANFYMIGRPREPMGAGAAIFNAVFNLVIAWAIVLTLKGGH